MTTGNRIGVIDVGTNSVLLTIAARKPNEVFHPVHEEAHITRIGEGLGSQPFFLPQAMERTLAVLASYKKSCEERAVDRMIIVGTAAFRRAHNAKDFVVEVEKKLGLTVEIISGKREAELSYRAAAQDFGDDLMVLDIGGGSTEYIWKTDHEIAALSLPLGSVVMHEKYVKSDPINDVDYHLLEAQIMSELTQVYGSRWGGGQSVMSQDVPQKLVALAGSATTLAAMKLDLATYSHAEVHGTVLAYDEVKALRDRLRAATIAERKQMNGIEPARADVILEGAMILLQTMELFGYDHVTISDRGVRWGLIYEEYDATRL